MKRILFLLSLLQVTLLASAYDIKVDGLCYNITSDNTVAVTYINFPNNDEYVEGDLVIPATVIYEGKKYAVTSIGKNAFYFCQFLTSVTLPSSLITIEDGAFVKCSALESVDIPEGVKEVGMAFGNCAYLQSIIIPSSVTKISSHFITNCLRLEAVACMAHIPPTFSSGTLADEYVTGKCSLKVPKESLEAYEVANGWKMFSKVEPYSAIKKDMSEYLTLSTYDSMKWTTADLRILDKAYMRLTKKYENGQAFIKESKGSELNMSEELFIVIKKIFEDSYAVMQKNKSGNSF